MSNASETIGVSFAAEVDLRYPIGRFQPAASDGCAANDGAAASDGIDERDHALEILAELPTRLYNAVDDLSESQLDTPYRSAGWTVRQVVHHLADSHMQAFQRMRFALTEDEPTVKTYDEKAWAELPDSQSAPVEWSLELIESLHARWVALLQRLTPEQWHRAYVHPENGRTTVEAALHLYAWHSRHHAAHIAQLRAANGW